MKPISLLLENFYCHTKSFIDFTEFKSACIIGSAENNDQRTNGIGKSKIFTAITYVLFNKTNLKNIENCIQHNAERCRVTFVFEATGSTWRVSRARDRKGASELILSEQHGDSWVVRDERTSAQMEKELFKIIKINYETFKNSVLFAQNDLEGIATLTSTARKDLLRETLQLQDYKKLEDITKKHMAILSKEIDKNNAILSTFVNNEKNIIEFENEIAKIDPLISSISESILIKKAEINVVSVEITLSNENINKTKTEADQLNSKIINTNNKINALTKSKEEFNHKLNKTNKDVEMISLNLNANKSNLKILETEPLEDIENIKAIIRDGQRVLNESSIEIKAIERLVIDSRYDLPKSKGPKCDHCKQPVSDEYRDQCQQHYNASQEALKIELIKHNDIINATSKKLEIEQAKYISYNNKIKQITELKNKISTSIKEINSSKEYFDTYQNFIKNTKTEISELKVTLAEDTKQLCEYNTEEINKQLRILNDKKSKLFVFKTALSNLELEYVNLSSAKKLALDRIEQAKNKIKEEKTIRTALIKDELSLNLHQLVSQAFSSKGIPTLIIHNMLDDLQTEANDIISQVKPGMQLKFEIDKENSKGEPTDKLDILYFKDGLEHEWEQLSGGQKLVIMLSLRLALIFVLHKNYGIDIKFLLLDEIDASLDKESLVMLFEMIRFIESNYKVLVISHNDSLKEKFTHTIVVEQNRNLESTAQVIAR